MRISEIISLARQYLFLGIIAALFVVIAFTIGYWVIYKKIFKGAKKIKLRRLCTYAVFVCYLVIVLGATMLDRGGFWTNNLQLHLFYSYREAWNDFSATEWRNIILNIIMFLPFGFLLPFISNRFRVYWKTYLAGFAFSLAIEVGQYVLKRGIFEIDDLFDNLLGAIIGYGFCRILFYVIERVKRKKVRIFPILMYQIPLLVTVAVFITIFMVYANQELGNLRSNYIYRLTNIEVNSNLHYSETEMKVPVYKLQVADENMTREQALKFFDTFDTGIDESRTDIYEDTAVYYNQDNKKCLWINYAGSTYWYTDFDEIHGQDASAVKENATEAEVRDALEILNVSIPNEVVFENKGSGKYEFIAEQVLINGTMYDGILNCTYTVNKKISNFTNDIIAYQPYKDFSIISEKEAFDRMVDGKFYYSNSGKLEINVSSVEPGYENDSKGFYQPVYIFKAEVNGKDTTISIPAIK